MASHSLGIRLYDRIATNLCISLVLVLGLQVFMGNSGILSFAHIGFMGVGAYTSAVLTIPAQMKGMALPDLYPFLQGVELSPLSGDRGRRASSPALVAAAVSYPLMRLSDAAAVITSFALLVVLYTVMTHWSALTNGPRTLFGLPRATDLPLAALVAAMLALVAALAFKESRTGPAAAGQPRRRARGRGDGRQHPGAALARLRPGGAVRRRRRRALGALHHLLLAEGLLSEGDVPHPVDAGDRRRQHGDRRGRRHLHRHRRL